MSSCRVLSEAAGQVPDRVAYELIADEQQHHQHGQQPGVPSEPAETGGHARKPRAFCFQVTHTVALASARTATQTPQVTRVISMCMQPPSERLEAVRPAVMAGRHRAGFVGDAVTQCDGVLLTGGDDVNPKLYTEKLSPKLAKTVHPAALERDHFEVALIEEVFRQKKPLLAVCRGQQILNIAFGGDLIVDIGIQRPDAENHCRMEQKNQVVHEVSLERGSLLAEALGGTKVGVNSTHHQAVGKIAKPLAATANSIDGIIEGMEFAPGARSMLPWLLAVQFHPERLFPQHAEHLDIFKSFVQACVRVRRTVV